MHIILIISLWKEEKMECISFLPKSIIICYKEKKGFDYKNNSQCDQLINFYLDNINNINCKILVILLYILLVLELKKV